MKKALRRNSPKGGSVLLPPLSLLPLWTQPKTAFTKFDFYGSSIQAFLVQAENGLWQHIKIAYEKKARLHSGLSLHKCQPKTLLSGKHNK